MVGAEGFEPPTLCFQSRCATPDWGVLLPQVSIKCQTRESRVLVFGVELKESAGPAQLQNRLHRVIFRARK